MNYSRTIVFGAALLIALVALVSFLLWSSRDSDGAFSIAEALSQNCAEIELGHYKVTIVAAEPGDRGSVRIAEIESSPSARRMRIVYLAESAQEIVINESPIAIERLPAHEVDVELVQFEDRVYLRGSDGSAGNSEATGKWAVIGESAAELLLTEVFGGLDELAASCLTAQEYAGQTDATFGWRETSTELDNTKRFMLEFTGPGGERADIWFDEGSARLLRYRTTYSLPDDSDAGLSKILAVRELVFSDIGVQNEIDEPTVG